MHFEILTEDVSSKRSLDILIPKIIDISRNTFRVIAYRGLGLGGIPKNLKPRTDASKRILLDQLPKLIRGYGNSLKQLPGGGMLVVLCDLDQRDRHGFLHELQNLLAQCHPQPDTRFALAIEEYEAWYLGDFTAILAAYPRAKQNVLKAYVNDSICGTWELLAEAIHPGGSKPLIEAGYRASGQVKSRWAETITPHMEVERNTSPSFRHMAAMLSSATSP